MAYKRIDFKEADSIAAWDARVWICRLLCVLLSGLFWLVPISRTAAQPNQPVNIVDVLVLYTAQARQTAGSTNAICASIDEAMFEANSVMQNSHANVRFRSVHTAEVAYTESGSVATDLSNLQNPQDPHLGQFAAALREQYAADLVCLITQSGSDYDFYGLQGPSASRAFSVMQLQYLTGLNYMPVTLSFNFGCQTSRNYADSVGAFTYSYGYTFDDTNGNEFSTVEGFDGQRLPFFSNPDITYYGVAAGVPTGSIGEANNTLVLSHTAPIVAAFRGTAPTTLPPTIQIIEPTGDTNSPLILSQGTNLMLRASASDPDGFVKQVNFYLLPTNSSTLQYLGCATNAPYVMIWSNVPVCSGKIVAQAVDDLGASTRVDSALQIVVQLTNDYFTNATVLTGSNVSVISTTYNATNGTVWYSWTSPAAGWLDVSIPNMQPGLSYVIYTGNNVSNLTSIQDNGGWMNDLNLQVTANKTYSISIAYDPTVTNAFNLDVNYEASPADDNFTNRAVLSNTGGVATDNNTAASWENGEPDNAWNATGENANATHKSVWWTWTAPSNGVVTFNADCDFYSFIQIEQGDALTNLTLLSWGYTDTTPIVVTAGESLQISVDGLNGQTGNIQLSAAMSPIPTNGIFANRTPLAGSWINLTNSNVGAAIETNSPAENQAGRLTTLWWSWVAPVSGWLTLTSPNGQFLDVFTGSVITNLTLVTNGTFVQFQATAGTTYDIAASGDPGTVELNLFFSTIQIVALANGAQFLLGGSTTLTVSSTTNDGTLQEMAFFTNGVFLGSVTNAPYSLVWSNLPAGTYSLYAQGTDMLGHGRTSPPITITVNYPEPSNDNFANRAAISGTWISLTNSDTGATAEPTDPAYPYSNYSNSIWWSWIAPGNGVATISVSGVVGNATGFAVFPDSSWPNPSPMFTGIGPVSFPVVSNTSYDIVAGGEPGNLNLQLVFSDLVITRPTNGATYLQGQNIPLQVALSQAEQPVAQMQFLDNGNVLATFTNTPYEGGVLSLPTGNHQFIAVATDTFGHARMSLPVNITVNYPPPPNGTFATATILSGAQISTNGTTLGGSNVWYSWTAPASAVYNATLEFNNAVPFQFEVYTGTNATNLTPVFSTENYGANGVFSPQLTFTAHAGTTYAILVGTAGNFSLQLAPSPYPEPTNDYFTNATVLTGADILINGTTLGSTLEPGESSFGPPVLPAASVWYSWTAPASGTTRLFVNGSLFIPQQIAVYTGSALTDLVSVDLVLQNGPPNFFPMDFNATAGATYYVTLQDIGNFTLEIAQDPANENISNAVALSGNQASANGFLPGPPNSSGLNTTNWYSWTAPSNGVAMIAFSGTNTPPGVGIYSGTVSNLARQSVIYSGGNITLFLATAGTTYFIDAYGQGKAFTFNLSYVSPPANDDFASRQPLSGVVVSATGTVANATLEPGEPSIPVGPFGATANATVWYSWVAPADGVVELSCPDGIGVYTGISVSNLVAVVPPALNYLTFPAIQGTEYEIVIGGTSVTLAGAVNPPSYFSLSLIEPKAQFVTPTNGSVFHAPANFEVVARTIDIDGAVVSVDFYDGTNLLAHVTNAPFQIACTNVPAGDYPLSLVATDEFGGVTTNVPIGVRVAPPNDNFTNAYVITGAATNFTTDNSGATTEPGEWLPGGATGRTLWWTWQAPANGTVTIGANGFAIAPSPNISVSPQDVIVIGTGPFGPPGSYSGPLIAVYTNSTLTDLGLCASNLNYFPSFFFGGSPWDVLPSVTFPVVGGQTYQISLDGVNGSYGPASVSFTFTPPPPPPSNDNFSQAAVLQGTQVSTSGTTVSATSETGEPLASTNLEVQSVWYSWTAPSSGETQVGEYDSFSLWGPSSTLSVAVYTGSQLANLTPISAGQGSASFYAQAGIMYKITVASLGGLQTNFDFYLSGPPPPPSAQPSQSGMFAGQGFHLSIAGDLGQSVVIQASTDLVNWETIDVDTMAGSIMDFIDADALIYPRRFYRTVPLEAFFDSQSMGSLAPANDEFANRVPLSGTNTQFAANNQYATSEPGEWLSDGASGKTLWWSWTFPTNATVTLAITSEQFNGQLEAAPQSGPEYVNGPLVFVFSGSNLQALKLVGSNAFRYVDPGYYGANAGPMLVRTNLQFEAAAGTTYSISVDGCNGSVGPFNISFSAALHPAFFDGEVALSEGVYYLQFPDNTLFGYYNYRFFPTLYHYDMGFEYFMDAQDDKHGEYLYDFTSGHFWYTSPSLFPYLYDFTFGEWIYYYPDTKRAGHYTTNPRYFYNFGKKKIITQ